MDKQAQWSIGATNEFLTCRNCKMQTHIEMAIKTGCRKCGSKYVPAVQLNPMVPLKIKFDRRRESKPFSTKKVFGVYNIKGDGWTAPFVPIPPKKPNHVRIICVSDTHNLERRIAMPDGEFDILIHGGDITMQGEPVAVEDFANWLDSLKNIKHKVVIAGNHDVTFHAEFWQRKWRAFSSVFHDSNSVINKLAREGIYYLEDSEVTLEGIRIYGSPWQPEFCDWAFNVIGEEEIKKYWDLIPTGIDVLATHGPPLGHGGICLPRGNDAGCPELLKAIQRTKPKVHVAGHIHEGYGHSSADGTVFINASSVNLMYRPANNPVVFDIGTDV